LCDILKFAKISAGAEMSSTVRKLSTVFEERVDWKKVALISAGVVATGVVAYGTYSYLYASTDQSAARASSSNASSKASAPVARVPPTKKESTVTTKQEKTVQGRRKSVLCNKVYYLQHHKTSPTHCA
jgi:uncharacterized membrane protein YebE (DUF533 family)